MPVKRPNDAWPVAPEATAYPRTISKRTNLAPVLKSLLLIPIVGAAVGIFGMIAQPHLHHTSTESVTSTATMIPASAAQESAATSVAPVLSEPSVPSVVATSQQPPVALPSPVLQQLSAPAAAVPQVSQTLPSPQVTTIAAQASVPTPSPREIVPVQPAPAVSSPAPAAPAPLPTAAIHTSVVPVTVPLTAVPVEMGIRNVNVVIAGHLYECYGQQAHLACDLKQ